jgi:polyisoprenoid-binding protein YceI
MKFITIALLAWVGHITQASSQGLYICKNARVTLFSSAPIEDIKASTATGASVYNASTGELAFSLSISSFQFEKSLMQEHFNSDYMESDKFPKATFKGKIQEQVDISKDGTYPVTVTGDLTVHGVTQKRSVPGTITVKNGVISMSSEFMVKCADHHITIPSIVFHNIAEIIKMNVSATYISNNNTKTK